MESKKRYPFYPDEELSPVCFRAEARWAAALLHDAHAPQARRIQERIVQVYDPGDRSFTQMTALQKPSNATCGETSTLLITEGPATGGLCLDPAVDSRSLDFVWDFKIPDIQGAEAVLLRVARKQQKFSSVSLARGIPIPGSGVENEVLRQAKAEEVGWFCSVVMFACAELGITLDQEQLLINVLGLVQYASKRKIISSPPQSS